MNFENIFYIQLIISFFVGGIFIAFLSYVAEHVHPKTAGIVLSLPSTSALAFFFIGWTLSAKEVAQAIPTTPAAMGASIILVLTYIKLAKIKFHKKSSSMALCTVGSVLMWLLIASPLATYKLSQLTVSLALYLFLTFIGYIFLTSTYTPTKQEVKLHYSWKQKIGRAIFTGLILSFIVILAKTFGAFWGTVFSMFPAAYLSSIVILHWYHSPDFLLKTTHNLPIASSILVIYALSVMYTFPPLGILWGSIMAYLISALYAIILYKITHS